MDILKNHKDFVNEEINLKFWEKDRSEMEKEILDSISNTKRYLYSFSRSQSSNDFEKYIDSLSKTIKIFNKTNKYSKKHENLFDDTLHDYLDDFTTVIKNLEINIIPSGKSPSYIEDKVMEYSSMIDEINILLKEFDIPIITLAGISYTDAN